MMNVLVVGGTGFLGGAVVNAAVAAGHSVTIFTRGQTANSQPPGKIAVLTGDRHRDLCALQGRVFDLVVDTCAFAPDSVSSLLDTLSPEIGRYALVSSGSAYGNFSTPNIGEDAPLGRASTEQLELARSLPPEKRAGAASYGMAYGPLKRECELAAIERLGDRVTIHRAGLLVGAGDYTDRLTFWLRRVDQGGPTVAPGSPDRLVQLIDVRDAARFIIETGVAGLGGAFNLTGRPLSMSSLLESCRRVAKSDARFVWRSDEDILAANLEPWSEVPLWLPYSNETFRYFLELDVEKAFAHGLCVRPLDETLSDILAWDRLRRATPLKAGMPPGKEASLLSTKQANVPG